DCGTLEGRSDSWAWQSWQALFNAWTQEGRLEQRIEGGESFHDIRDRFVPFVEGLVDRYGSSEVRIVCISHGGLYRMMLPLVLKNVDQDLINARGFEYASCVVAEARLEGLYCVEWNEHLGAH
ncbi:MAG: histidine phosphatase family protein, partial [Bacteroidota bacterium]